MPKFIFIRTLLFSFIFANVPLHAQQVKTSNDEELQLRKNNTIQFLKFKPSEQPAETAIDEWIVNNITTNYPLFSFQLAKKKTDKQGFTHYTYQEYRADTMVEFGVLKFHAKEGKVLSMNAEYYVNKEALQPKVISLETSLEKARSIMLAKQASEKSIEISFLQEVYFPLENNNLELCYKLEASAHKPTYQKYFFYISAMDNRLIQEYNQVENFNATGTAHTKYTGAHAIITDSTSPNNYTLKRTGTHNFEVKNANNTTNSFGATPYTDLDNLWNTDSVAYDAFYGMEKTLDYYLLEQGRNSFDDQGSPMLGLVHWGVNIVNAGGGTATISFGDGDGITSSSLTTTEIVGHEITHAVTGTSAGLVYLNEPGALNESFSDIFGVVVDFYANPATANFKNGDQVYNNGNYFRDMANPNAKGQPDTYLGNNWYLGTFDDGGVHNNSQVQNYWFYLLSQGGNGVNDNQDSFAVSGVGIFTAADIAYRTLNVYLTGNSNYFDARTYSIQAAIDLFGACSPQVISVTNAWHAVGIGNVYSSAVFAGFITSQTINCNAPATILFNNISNNATIYLWDFGDGGNSTLSSPVHTYTTNGNFSVSLIVTGNGCNSTDTFTMNNYIAVNNLTPLTVASCVPITLNTVLYTGITNVQFATINNTTTNAVEGYKDFSCSMQATLVAGNSYPISISTGYNNYVKAYIDYNNDGVFTSSELCFQSNVPFFHTGIINTNVNAVLNTPLRLRVLSAKTPIVDACTNLSNGQAEDYSIIFIANTLAPIANFNVADTIVSLNSSINFQDVSSNAPTSWQWTINGGSPNVSTMQNSSATFNTLGVFAIKLKVINAFGSDSITKTIHVIDTFTMCSTVQVSHSLNGTLYDSGGPLNDYQNNENCHFLIQPNVTCIDSITITITQFSTPTCCDEIVIFDGSNNNNPNSLIYSTNQQGPIPTPTTFTAYSGSIYIQFGTDNNVTDSGFTASWTTYQSTITPPIANFSISNSTPPLLDTVHFTDLSSNNTSSWQWDFGDGTTSALQHPNHIYSSSGTYTVTLIATSCLAFDTISYTLMVQASPTISFTPSSYALAMGCNDTMNVNVYISNIAGGVLNYTVQQTTGSIANGGVDTVSLEFYSAGLSGGLHTFYVAVQSNDINNPIDTITMNINVSMNPCVDFSQVQPSTCLGTINFMDNTLNNPSTWYWNFGDGAISTQQNPNHTYLGNGIYNVKLVATNSSGVDSIEHMVTILSSSSPATTSCNMPSTSNSCSYCGITNVKIGSINNPSSGASTYEDFTCTDQTVLHKGQIYPITIGTIPLNLQLFGCYIDYNNDGSFTGSEIIFNGILASQDSFTFYISIPNTALTNTPIRMRVAAALTNFTICDTIDYGHAEDYSLIILDSALVANFVASPTTVYVGQNVQFTDLSLGSPAAWNWQLPNSSLLSATIQNPMTSYATVGNYSATLIASNSNYTDTFTQQNYIHVIPLPTNSFTHQFNNCDSDVTVTTNLLFPFTTCTWDFGDGTIVTNAPTSLSHHYNIPGAYIVKLICFSPYGNDTVSNNVNVNIWKPTINSIGTKQTGTSINFSVNSINMITAYYWDFGNGIISGISNPSTIYSSTGTYIVAAAVLDIYGCAQVVYDTIQISYPLLVDHIEVNDGVLVFPNPFVNQITLSFTNPHILSSDVVVKIIDMQGNIIKKEVFKNQKEYTISFGENLSAGNYLLQVFIDDIVYLYKISK